MVRDAPATLIAKPLDGIGNGEFGGSLVALPSGSTCQECREVEMEVEVHDVTTMGYAAMHAGGRRGIPGLGWWSVAYLTTRGNQPIKPSMTLQPNGTARKWSCGATSERAIDAACPRGYNVTRRRLPTSRHIRQPRSDYKLGQRGGTEGDTLPDH